MNLGCSLIKFWWVLLVGFLVKLENNATAGCLEAERVALLRLKDAFNHPNGSALPSWQGQGDCCTWESVVCDNSTKRVTHLHLSETRPYELSNLQWSLNASSFLPFEELQELDLSNNYLSGLSHFNYYINDISNNLSVQFFYRFFLLLFLTKNSFQILKQVVR